MPSGESISFVRYSLWFGVIFVSYDVTFHSISENELHRYVFDILKQPDLLNSRAKEVSSEKAKQDSFIELFEVFLIPWYVDGKVSTGDKITPENFDSYFSFGIASVAGFLHPYWYAQNTAISLLKDKIPFVDTLFESFSSLDNSPLAKFEADSSKKFTTNYSASGVLKNVSIFRDWLEENRSSLMETIHEDYFDSLMRALNYCVENQLYFIEASEIVIPLTNECQSDIDNLRAHFLKNLDLPHNPRPIANDEKIEGRNQCKKCGSNIGLIDIFKAGLPNLIACGKCNARVKFNISPYIEYPCIFSIFIIFAAVAFYCGDYLISNEILPVKNKYIVLGVGLSFAALFEVLFSFWLLKAKRVIG